MNYGIYHETKFICVHACVYVCVCESVVYVFECMYIVCVYNVCVYIYCVYYM